MQKINLLPPELRKDPTVDLKRIIRIAAVTTVMGLLALAFISLVFNNYLKEKEIETIRAEIAALQPKVKKVEKLKSEIAKDQRRITTYKNILAKPLPWPELLRDIAFNSPTDLWLTEVQTSRVETALESKNDANKENTNNSKTKAGEQAKPVKSELFLIIRGSAPSLSTIGVFMLHLNQLSSLETVDLVLAKENVVEGRPGNLLDFEIKTKLKTSQEGGQK